MSASNIEIIASFQDQASAGLNTLRTNLGAMGSAAGQASGSFNPLNTAMGATGNSARLTTGAVQPLSPALGATGSAASSASAPISSLGGIFGGAGTQARTANQSLTPLGETFGKVATGGITANNALTPLNMNMQNTGTVADKTGVASIGLGQKIGLLGGFIGSTVSSVFSLVTGYTSLEAATIKNEKAQVMAEAASLKVEKAQDSLTKAIAKYGPESRQAAEAAKTLEIAKGRDSVASERAALTQSQLTEKQVEYGMQVIGVVSNIAQMGSTISILTTALKGSQTATEGATLAQGAMATTSGEASIAQGVMGATASVAAVEETALGGAGDVAAEGETAAAVATSGMAAELLAIVAPIAAAIILFALIETNTFGMGDAFRSTTVVIAQAIDGIATEINSLWNGFIQFGNNISGFSSTFINLMIDVENGVITALNGIIAAAESFVQQFNNALVGIYNFFVNSVANPVIDAWNTFLKNMISPVSSAVSGILSAFKPLIGGIIDAFVTMGQGINTLLTSLGRTPIDLTNLTNFQYQLKHTTDVAGTVNPAIAAAFKPAPEIKLMTEDTSKLNQSLIPLAKGYIDVAAASHVYDDAIHKGKVTTAEAIAQTVNWYSHQENLASVINTNVKPAIQGFVGQISSTVKGLTEWMGGTDKATDSQKKLGGEIPKTAAALDAQAKSIATVESAWIKDIDSLNTNILMMKSGELQTLAYNDAVTKQDNVLLENAKQLMANAATNKTLNEQINQGAILVENYNLGWQKETKILLDAKVALATTAGEQAKLDQELAIGAKQAVAFTDGLLKAHGATQTMITDTSTAQGKIAGIREEFASGALQAALYAKAVAETGTAYQAAVSKLYELNAQLTDGTAITNRHNTAIEQGKINFDQLIISTQDAATTQKEYDTELDNAVGQSQIFNGVLAKTPANLELVSKAALGNVDALAQVSKAIQDVLGWFTQLGDQVASKLGEAMDKGGKAFSKAIKDLSKQTGVDFKGLGLEAQLGIAGGMDLAKKQLTTDLSTMSSLVGASKPQMQAAAEQMITGLTATITKAGGQITPQWQKIFTDMRTIAANPITSVAAVNALADLRTQMAALGVPTADATAFISKFGGSTVQAASQIKTMSSAATLVANSFTNLGNTVNTATGAVTNSAGKLVGTIDKVTGAFTPVPGAVAPATSALKGFNTQIQSMGTLDSVAQTVFQSIAKNAGLMAVAVGTAFKTMLTNVVPSLGTLASVTQTTFTGMMTTINTFIASMSITLSKGVNTATQAVNTAFKTMQGDVAGDLGAILGQITIFVTTMTSTLSKGVISATVAVNAGFKTMQSDVGGNLGTIISLINTFDTNMVSAFTKGLANANSAVVSAFNTMKSNVTSAMNSIVSSIQSSVNSAIGIINQLKTAIASIPTSHVTTLTAIDNVSSVARSVTNAINNIPTSHTTTLTTVNRTVFAASGFHGVVSTATPFMVGEAGPEQVDITPAGQGGGGSNAHAPSRQARNTGEGSSGGTQTLNLNITSPVILNGKEIARAVKKDIFTLSSGGT